MDMSERKKWITEAKDAVLNMASVLPHAMKKDETFLDLDISVMNGLCKASLDDREGIIMEVKEVQRCLSNFLRVHPDDVGKNPVSKPFIDHLKTALQKLLNS